MLSKLRRLYLKDQLFEEKKVTITDKDYLNRILNVLRLKTNEEIRVFNEIDGEYLAELLEVTKKHLVLSIKDHIRKKDPEYFSSLILPLFKPDRLRWLIEKATELRVKKIIFYNSQNSQKYNYNEEKILKYIVAACEQCERISLPSVGFENNIKSALEAFDKVILCNEKEKETFITKAMQQTTDKNIAIMVGPEGGFISDELAKLKELKNVCSVHLGSTIMRVETAALYALSAADAHLEGSSSYE